MLLNEGGFDWTGTILVEKREDEEQIQGANIFSKMKNQTIKSTNAHTPGFAKGSGESSFFNFRRMFKIFGSD